MRIFTSEEISIRNGKNSAEIWIVYKGFIYDVTASELFKGGKHYRLETGRDLTQELKKAPHTEELLNNFPIIGILGE